MGRNVIHNNTQQGKDVQYLNPFPLGKVYSAYLSYGRHDML